MMRLRIIVLGLISLLVTALLQAQSTFTWTGAGGDNLFNNPDNWQGGLVPAGNSTDNLVFLNSPQPNIQITSSLNVGDVTFSGIQNGYYLVYQYPDSPTLTINGNVTTGSGAIYWGLFDLPVILSPGNHIYTAGGNADIYHFDTISGSGGITKNGAHNLILTKANSYTGGTILNSGVLYVGESSGLGTGDVTINGGTLGTSYTNGAVTLANNFILNANPNFGTGVSDAAPLTLGSNELGTTVAPNTGVTTVNFNLDGIQPLTIDGRMVDGASATTYTFTGASTYFLSGTNSYTGGTLVHSGATLIFDQGGSIPASGSISTETDGYVGLGDSSVSADTFVGHLNPAAFDGIIGFDNGNVYNGPIDLTNFNSNVAIGTSSTATLTGEITPSSGSNTYTFSGSGTLFLADNGTSYPLTGNRDLFVSTRYSRPPLMLVLGRTGGSDYTGSTTADHAGIIFDTATSLSTYTSLYLSDNGYIGVTDASGLSLASITSNLAGISPQSAIGIDSSAHLRDGDSTLSYAGAIDLSSLSQPVYLGSATSTEITGSIITSNGGADDYYFTGYNSGYLKISTALTGSRQVHVGLPGAYQDIANGGGFSTVELGNTTNDFTGDVILNSGLLVANNPLALGSGNLTVDASSTDGFAGLQSSGTFTKSINLQSGTLQVQNGGGLNLNGTISGSGSLASSDTFNISGNNTYAGGSTFSGNTIYADNDHALGSGSVSLVQGAQVVFSTATPAIGSLLQGDAYTSDGTYQAALKLAGSSGTTLTINQTVDATFAGAIVEYGSVGSVIKTGPASLTILGNINVDETYYTGGTTILQGTLIAGNSRSFGSGTITLNGGSVGALPGIVIGNNIVFGANGGTLSGNSTFSTPITAGTNVILSPGNSPGTLTFTSGLTLASGGSMVFQVQSANGPAGTGYDLLAVSGALLNITATSGAPFTIYLTSLNGSGSAGAVADFSSSTAYSWTFATSALGVTGFAANEFVLDTSAFTNSIGTGTFSLAQSGNDLVVNFTPVPEPSTYALLALGLATSGFAAYRRRRRT